MNAEILVLAGLAGLVFMIALLAFVYYRGMALLQYYQQDEYDSDRFLKWLLKKRAFDKKATLILLVSFIGWSLLQHIDPPSFNLIFYLLVLLSLVTGTLASRPKKDKVKKPLVMTARAQRIFFTYLLLVGAYFGGVLGSFKETNLTALMLSFLFFLQWPPLFLVAANFVLKPIEDGIAKKLVKEADEKLAGLSPKIIAITGSFGKTSIKHILAHILSATAPTLATPGSVNTVMGIVRIIRENLEAKHKYFVVEMGAYGPGSIQRLCQLTPPALGIISAIGHAHFERFKSLETVFKAKFEMADDLKRRGGKVIVNASAMDRDMLKNYMTGNKGVIVCGDEKAKFARGCTLKGYEQGKDGLKIDLDVTWQGKKRPLALSVPLFGPHQAWNIMLAVAAALELGIDPDVIKAALKTMPQIRHRLEVVRLKKGPVIIDDAYNSNPEGFSSALDLLKALKPKGGRAILVTPGMVEMGKAHDEAHAKIGDKAAGIVDVALIVGPDRMRSFINAFGAKAPVNARLESFYHQKDAEKWIAEKAAANDVVLFENNLPDLYETDIRF